MNWLACPDVESVPGRVSGAWVFKGTRVPADALVLNARGGCSPEEIVEEIFPTVPLDAARRILVFAGMHEARGARRDHAGQ